MVDTSPELVLHNGKIVTVDDDFSIVQALAVSGERIVATGTDADCIAAVVACTAFIEPGSPWHKGYIESFNARLRNELLNGEIFYTLKEAQVLVETWQYHYNVVCPHRSLRNQPPAPVSGGRSMF